MYANLRQQFLWAQALTIATLPSCSACGTWPRRRWRGHIWTRGNGPALELGAVPLQEPQMCMVHICHCGDESLKMPRREVLRRVGKCCWSLMTWQELPPWFWERQNIASRHPGKETYNCDIPLRVSKTHMQNPWWANHVFFSQCFPGLDSPYISSSAIEAWTCWVWMVPMPLAAGMRRFPSRRWGASCAWRSGSTRPGWQMPVILIEMEKTFQLVHKRFQDISRLEPWFWNWYWFWSHSVNAALKLKHSVLGCQTLQLHLARRRNVPWWPAAAGCPTRSKPGSRTLTPSIGSLQTGRWRGWSCGKE